MFFSPPAPAPSSGTASAGLCWPAWARGRTDTAGHTASEPSCSCARWRPALCPSHQSWETPGPPRRRQAEPDEDTGQTEERATFAALLLSCEGVCSGAKSPNSERCTPKLKHVLMFDLTFTNRSSKMICSPLSLTFPSPSLSFLALKSQELLFPSFNLLIY